MPTRYLRPGIRDSDTIDSVSPVAETLFYRLLVTVDDFGRYDARPTMVKAACFPNKKSVDYEACASLLDELASAGLLALFSVDGKPYLQLQKWDNAPRAKESKFPAPEDERAHVHTFVCKPSTVLPGTGTGTGTENREPETENRNRQPKPTLATPTAKAVKAATPTADTWDNYASQYRARYGETPVRNAKVNGQLSNLIARLGADEAPQVAAFYVGLQRGDYVKAMHPVDMLLRDAESLRTAWVTGRSVTATQAQQADRTQTNLNAFGPLIAAAEKREREASDA